MKNFLTFVFMTGLASMAACSSEDSTGGTGGSGTGGSATGGTGGSGTGGSGTGGSAGMATGGTAGMATGGMAGMAGAAGGTGQDCVTCLTTNCSTELGACQASADCTKIISCAGACADQACADKCVTDNPGGKTAWDAVEACGTTKCATECT
jgi:hypothetical protein